MKYAFIAIGFFICVSGFSQDKDNDDVKVGLVLSGGGAKGLAHIGVLKAIDSLGVRIDYIAGTSMGAVIGSLYASGYSGKQLDSIFNLVDFDDLINDNLPRSSKTFYERDNSEKYAVVLPFEDFKIKLPSALSRGQNAYGLLSKSMLHINGIKDFAKLPIPFFCMATNIETGQVVMLEKGNLAQAVMASSALPSLFQPVIIDDQVLIDGGVVNNYPIDELKAKGVDVIIGIDVQDTLAARKDLKSAPDILVQINNYRTINEMKIKSKKTDVYIKPNIKGFNVVSFSEGEQIIKIGNVEALKHSDELHKIVAKQLEGKKQKVNIKSIDSIKINSIKIEGNDNYTRAYILGKLKLKNNQKMSYNDFYRGVNNLVATNNFDNFLYELQSSKYDEGYDMVATLNESSKKTFLKAGIHYDDLYKSAALLNITKKQLLTKNDVVSFDFIIGDNVRYNFEYYIDNGVYWSIGVKSRYNEFHKNVAAQTIVSPEDIALINVNKLDLEVSDFTNQVYLQTLFRKDLSLTLGAEHKRLKLSSETVLTELDTEETIYENSDYLSLFGKLKFDTYDNKYFPKAGFLFDTDFHMYLYASDFNNDFSGFSIAKGSVGYAQNLLKNVSANLSAEAGFKLGEDDNSYFNFVLGGYGNNLINNYISFYGYDFLTLSADSFIKSTVTFDYEFYKKNHIILAANVANVADGIFKTGQWFSSPNYTGYALGYSLETFLGPIEAKYTWSPEIKKSIFFFNIGFWF